MGDETELTKLSFELAAWVGGATAALGLGTLLGWITGDKDWVYTLPGVVGIAFLFYLAAKILGVAYRIIARVVNAGVVLSRTGALRGASQEAKRQLKDVGWATELPLPSLHLQRWIWPALWRRARPYIQNLMGVVALIMGVVTYQAGSAPLLIWATLCPLLISLGLFFMKPDRLPERVAKICSEALDAPLTVHEFNGEQSWWLPLPHGPHVELAGYGRASNPWGLRVRMACVLPFNLAPTRVDQLAEEAHDFDVGDARFDQACLLTPHANALCSAWLTPTLRVQLLWVLSNGMVLKDGIFEGVVDLRTPLALSRLDELLLSLSTLNRQLTEGPQSDQARAAAILPLLNDVQRQVLLAECSGLTDPSLAQRICRDWAIDGEGPTRLQAANALSGDAQLEALKPIINDPKESAVMRAQALHLAFKMDQHLEILARWAEQGEAGLILSFAQQLIAQQVGLSPKAQREVVRQLRQVKISEAAAVPVAAALMAMGAIAVKRYKVSKLVRWLKHPPLSKESRAAIGLLVDTTSESDGHLKLRRAAIDAWAAQQSRLEGLRGGLAVSTEGEGGLSIAEETHTSGPIG